MDVNMTCLRAHGIQILGLKFISSTGGSKSCPDLEISTLEINFTYFFLLYKMELLEILKLKFVAHIMFLLDMIAIRNWIIQRNPLWFKTWTFF